ncbi:MAG: ABC transporter permease subunit [Phycisphaerae bacterium]|nr:ABC transporter permease subunit [Phycisphaerae bacterium]
MFPKLFAIAGNTFVETVRQPIYGVLTWVAVGALILNPALVGFTLQSADDLKMAKDIGLATLLLYGLLASVFSATSVITREIESHTVLTVISKPVSRPLFLFGKYLGVCGAVLVGYYFLCLVLLMTIRHGTMPTATDEYDQPVLLFSVLVLLVSLIAATFGNYVYGWHFTTTLTAWVVPLGTLALIIVMFVSPEWKIQPPGTDFGDMQLAYAVTMTFCGVLILAAFAVTLAARFSQVLTLLLCTGVYILGLISDYLLGRPAAAGEAWFYQVLYAIIPNFQFFWAGDALTQEQTIPAIQVGRVAVYSGLYSLGVLGLGVALFEKREVS